MKRVLTQAMVQAIATNDIDAIKRCYRYGARASDADVTHALNRGDIQPTTLAFLYKLAVPTTVEHIAVAIRGDKPDLLKVVLDTLSNHPSFLNQHSTTLGSGSCAPSYLAWAAQRKMQQIVEILLSYGASPSFPDSLGEPPIHYALLGGSLPVIEAIESAIAAEPEAGLPVDEEKRASQVSLADHLSHAIYERNIAVVEATLKAQPPLDASFGADYWAPLVGAVNPAVRTIANLLVRSGVSPFERSQRSSAAVMQAVIECDTEMFDLFLQQNHASLNHASVDYSRGEDEHLEQTPLGFALTKRGYLADKFVQYLLKTGARLDGVNAMGDSAEAVAKRSGSEVAKRMLEEYDLTGRVPEFTVEFMPSYAAAQAMEAGDIEALREMHESGTVNLAKVRIRRHANAYDETLLEFLTATRLPFEQMRELALFLVSEVGLALDEEVWGVHQMDHALHGLFELGDAALIDIMLLALSPEIREKTVVKGHLLFGAMSLGSVQLVRSLLTLGANPLQDWQGKPALQYLEKHYRHLDNYEELWTVLNDAAEAAKAAQASQVAVSEEAVQA
jgi:ankyrin repeat protein